MPFAAVLSRVSRYFYLRLSRFSTRKGNAGSGLCPHTTLRHHATLQALSALRQGIPLLSADPPRPQHLCVIRVVRRGSPFLEQDNACAFSGHLLTVEMLPNPAGDGCSPMLQLLKRKLPFVLGCLLVAAAFPYALHAQLVRENTAPPQPQVSAKQDSQGNASAPMPQGKKRLSQEVQLTGEESWIDTSIEIHAAEHVSIIATGKLRYADAKDDNGPDGLPRGVKDLLRVLPFNEAGRGALIGRIGDKDIAQPFVIGARRDVLAPVSGLLRGGLNHTADDAGDATYAVRIEAYTPEGGTARVVARQVGSFPGIDNNLLSRIPRRVADKQGNPGDMANFLTLGPEPAIHRVCTTRGWRGEVLRAYQKDHEEGRQTGEWGDIPFERPGAHPQARRIHR